MTTSNDVRGLGRRVLLNSLGALPVAALATTSAKGQAARGVLRYVASAEPVTLDPVASTLAVTQEHAYLVYDNLFSLDSTFQPRPQMVERVETSEDGKVWTMTLRDGLLFHDGSPVTSADVVASIARWAKRDTAGRKLVAMGMQLEAVDTKMFQLRLSYATPFLLEALAKPTGSALFIMREREAKADPIKPVEEIVGSGPFRFVQAEYRPGHLLVYERNPNYRPRNEKPDYLAGGKVAKVDRVEWLVMPDSGTAVAALQRGEIDIYETPPTDLLPILKLHPEIVITANNRQGSVAFLRPNFLHPPFDRPEGRRALALAMNQLDSMAMVAGDDPAMGRNCYSYLSCGGANESEVGTEGLRQQNIAEARNIFRSIGYDGAPVVFIAPGNHEALRNIALLAAEQMRAAGLTVDLQLSDFASMIARRNSKERPAQGGWNLFPMLSFGFELDNPATNPFLTATCDNDGYAGWACNPELERLKEAWLRESDPQRRHPLVMQIQAEAAQLMPVVLLGQFLRPLAHRREVRGLLPAPIPVMWNAEVVR